MPCRYDESPEEIAACKKSANENLVKPYRDKLDKVTRLLCAVMTLNESSLASAWTVAAMTEHKELQAWWKEHQIVDTRRIINEEVATIRAKAMKKLTPKEKKALGLTK